MHRAEGFRIRAGGWIRADIPKRRTPIDVQGNPDTRCLGLIHRPTQTGSRRCSGQRNRADEQPLGLGDQGRPGPLQLGLIEGLIREPLALVAGKALEDPLAIGVATHQDNTTRARGIPLQTRQLHAAVGHQLFKRLADRIASQPSDKG